MFKQSLNIPYDSTLVFSVGELNENKNHRLVIKTIASMKNPCIHYLMAGTGEKEDELKELALNEKIENQVHLLGYRQDIAELLNVMDIYCLPSIREGLNVSLMEAMASGLPCIAKKMRGNTDLIVENIGGYLSTDNTSDQWEEYVRVILESHTIRNDMGRFNSFYINKFGTFEVRKCMKDIYY